ncbi:unnamed protein product [Calypogeia fissa]
MPVGGAIMSLAIGRSFLSGSNNIVAIYHLPRSGCSKSSTNSLFRISERSLCGLSQSRRLTIPSFSLTSLLEASIRTSIRSSSSSSRAVMSYASKTSWDEAAESYFPSDEGVKETPPSSKSAGVRKWKSPASRERQDFRNSDAYEGDANGRATRSRNSESADTEQKDVERRSRYGGADRNRTDDKWQKPAAKGYRSREGGAYSARSGSDWQTRGKKPDYNIGQDDRAGYGDERSREGGAYSARSRSDWQTRGKKPDYNIGQDDRAGGYGDDRRWQAREYSPPLPVEGQAVYGVAPIISALQISRRTFYTLYMQENLLLNIGLGRRKDKGAITTIEKMAKGMGVTIKEASKHDLNMLVDNRPHQGLILDASPLELTPVDTLDPPVYQDNKTPVWVALDEVTDPQNFGAILRSAYFLGAEGVVVCAKNSAPLSGVVSKASAGAMEVMEVLFCKNMVRFLDRCKENGWRVVGASAESASVPVRQLPNGVATILVLGSEGKGLRTNVKRACDQLVSIAGASTSNQRPKYDFVAQDFEDEDLDVEEDEESVGRRGTESGLVSGPSAVDSLNVSVAAGILLYELLDSPTEKDTLLNN